MKTALKLAVVAVALVASPALAKDTTNTKETTTKDGATKTVVKHKKHVSTTTTTSAPASARRFDGGTFLGFPIQANGNPEDLRRSRTIQR